MALLQAGDAEGAAAAATERLEADQEDAQAWLELGHARTELDDVEGALEAYERAFDLGISAPQMAVRAARLAAGIERQDEALEWIERAVEAGLPLGLFTEHAATAPVREALGETERWAELMKTAAANTFPCRADERYQAFDFWIGEWEVFNPQGQKVGDNTITSIMEGCALEEQWVSGTGNPGMSINYYDPSSDTWKQNWVSAGGTVIRYEGKVADGAMHFKGENVSPDGTTTLADVTLTPQEDGSVEHRIQESKDGGETWTLEFVGIYRPKGKE
jgi:tetratricopeptide (TPR) repeat protein